MRIIRLVTTGILNVFCPLIYHRIFFFLYPSRTNSIQQPSFSQSHPFEFSEVFSTSHESSTFSGDPLAESRSGLGSVGTKHLANNICIKNCTHLSDPR